MQVINYCKVPDNRKSCWVPKIGSRIEVVILSKLQIKGVLLGSFYRKSRNKVYYRTTGGLYWKVFTDFAPAFKLNGNKGHSSRETFFTVESEQIAKATVACLSSNIFWWWYTITSNLRDLNPYDIQNFRVPSSVLMSTEAAKLGTKYINDLIANSCSLVRNQKQTGKTETQSFTISKSKPIIDQMRTALRSAL